MPTRRTILLTLAAIASAAASLALVPQPSDPKPAPAAATVRLTIDYHDGVQKTFTQLPHTAGMTVFDALKLARDHASPRAITFVSTGSGETAFIKQIDDLKNQGGGKATLNWQYQINGKLGTVGVGAAKLQPGDAVLWEFEIYKVP